MEPVRLGIIGCGVIGTAHAQFSTQSPNVKVAAVADLIPERVKNIADRFDIDKTYADGDALINDPEIEAVTLALPAVWRTPLALRALAKGKHVLIEKPVAMNAAEVERLIAARGALTVACCSSRFRFLPSAQAATAFIASGALGELRVVRARAIGAGRKPPAKMPPPWRLIRALNGGGILMNWGCYDLDYLLGLTGWKLEPETVLAQTWTVPPAYESHIYPGSDAETHFVALIRCASGAAITYERGEYVAATGEDVWQITGSQGSLHLNMLAAKGKRLILDRASSEEGVISETLWEGDEDGNIPTYAPIQDFAAAIREGREPETTLEKALVVQKISDAIYASAASGRMVEIS